MSIGIRRDHGGSRPCTSRSTPAQSSRHTQRRGPLEKIQVYATRMDWRCPWYWSHGTDFNLDYHVSVAPEQRAAGVAEYNYTPRTGRLTGLPGVSVFAKDQSGAVFHTYSCYARGLDMLNTAYQYLDLTPKGRDEAGLPRRLPRD